MTTTAQKTVKRVKGLAGLMAGFFGVQLFVNIANGGGANSLVPNIVAHLDPSHKVAVLGLVGAAAAVGAVITQPIWGLLSDRTRSGLGRRVPWILAGVAGLVLVLIGFAVSNSIVLITILATLFAIFYSMVGGPLSAIIPDRAPVARRGVFAALGSLGVFIGGLIGVIVASQFVSKLPLGFLVLAVVALISIPFAFMLRDRKLDEITPSTRISWAETLKGFFVNPRKHPDFFWAFVARLVLIVGFWSVSSFQLYILDDYIGLGLKKANTVFPIVTAVLAVAIIVALVPTGIISDRIGRRKPFVVIASLIVGAGALVPIFWATVPGAIVSIGIIGLGVGTYLAVDQALMTQVLPNASTSAGKDLGILNIAQAGGQVISPLLASLVIGLGGYPTLYIFAAVTALLAAVAVLPIKSVR